MASFTKEVNPGLAKRPLVFNGRLADLGLTSFVKEAIVRYPVSGRSNGDLNHYDDVITGTIASLITSLTIVYSTVYSGADHKNIKAPRTWPLCGEFTGAGEFPAQMASNAENVSIWWRHHDKQISLWSSIFGWF